MSNELSNEDKIKQQQLFALMQQLKLIDLDVYPYRLQQQIVGTFKREDLKKYLEAPELEPNQKQLRKISKFLYNASTHYKRLLWYFENLLCHDYYVEPYGLDLDKVNKKTFKKSYQKIVDLVEMMNLKHELNKINKILYRDGIYYGYVHAGKDSFFFQELDPDFCKITYIDDGCLGFAFNFGFFLTYPERLKTYPEEFQTKAEKLLGVDYVRSLTGVVSDKKTKITKPKSGTYWENIDIDKSICIKTGSEWYPIPPFVGLFDQILNISDFKSLEKANSEIGNYKILFQQIPMETKDGNANNFLITEDFVKLFHDNISQSLPPQVGIITSPMKVEPISFERDKVDRNKVSEATKQFWSESGVPDVLFSGDTTGSIGLNLSVKTDESIAFSSLRQYERWINRYLKQFSGSYKFRVRMPDVTIFNKDEYRDALLKNAQYGIPVKIQLAALDMSPSGIQNLAFLENEILELPDKLKPLMSSHTAVNGEDGGRPTSKKLSDSGAKTKDGNANQNRAK